MKRVVTDEQLIDAWKRLGSPSLIANEFGITTSTVHNRTRRVTAQTGIKLETWNDLSVRRVTLKHDEGRIDYALPNGSIIVFSDAHFWPGVRTTAFRALLSLTKQIKPTAIVCNGDAFDGGSISRWPRIGWDKKPTVKEELDAVKERLGEIEKNYKGDLFWPLGNHDARFETRLAAAAPEFEGVAGFTLKEHFPAWKPCWTVWVNMDAIICHYWHSGIHDTHNNLLKGQCHQITGHTHSLKWTPWTGSQGRTIYGVNTGTLADSLASHNSDYQHGLHGNHRSGFAVLTWRDGKLMMPELVQVWDSDTVNFRGHLLNADTGAIV